MTAVLVGDETPVAGAAVRRAVASVPGVDRRGAPGRGAEVVARHPLQRPDVVLMDVRMPGIGGVEATRRLMAAYPRAVVVMLTRGEDFKGTAAAVAVNHGGSHQKTATMISLAVTVTVTITATPTGHGSGNTVSTPARPTAVGPSLSGREVEVLEGMARGRTNAQIGRELDLAADTVKTHARRMFRKMGAADRAQAVALGFRWGLLSHDSHEAPDLPAGDHDLPNRDPSWAQPERGLDSSGWGG